MTIKQILVKSQAAICLGKQGENEVVEVIFPQPSELMAEEWQLNHQRVTDREAYPCPLEKRDNALAWRVTSGDTAVPGIGAAELTCYGKDGEILKSCTYSTSVLKSITTGGEVPDPVKPWYDDIMERLGQGGGGTVKSVNGIEPDENGNVQIDNGTERTEEDVTGSVIEGEYVNATTGRVITAGGYSRTDYIPVEDGDVFYYTGRINNNAGVAGYNAEKKYVQNVLMNASDRVVYTDQELSVGAEVKYIIGSTMGSQYPVKLIRSREATKGIEDDSIDAEKMKSEDYILPGLNNFAAFSSFTAIGDSLTVGLYPAGTNESGETTWSKENSEHYCWPFFLAQLTGATHLNYGISGATAKKWCEDANGLAKMLAGKKTQAYIIGLGFNDQAYLTDDYPLGTIDDIHTDDYTQNGDTFAGWYGKVIQNIMEFAPDAKIFCLNNPRVRTAHGDACFELIRRICGLEAFQGHVFFVDLREWVRFYNAPAVEKYRVGVHYSAPGYAQCAKIMLPAISEAMNENAGEFKTIPLIPYD